VTSLRSLPANGMNFRHTAEGPDDHAPRTSGSALTQTSLGIPLHQGRRGLGTWQGLYVSSIAARRTGAR